MSFKQYNCFIRKFIAYILVLSFGLTSTTYGSWESVFYDGGYYSDTSSVFITADHPLTTPDRSRILGYDIDEFGNHYTLESEASADAVRLLKYNSDGTFNSVIKDSGIARFRGLLEVDASNNHYYIGNNGGNGSSMGQYHKNGNWTRYTIDNNNNLLETKSGRESPGMISIAEDGTVYGHENYIRYTTVDFVTNGSAYTSNRIGVDVYRTNRDMLRPKTDLRVLGADNTHFDERFHPQMILNEEEVTLADGTTKTKHFLYSRLGRKQYTNNDGHIFKTDVETGRTYNLVGDLMARYTLGTLNGSSRQYTHPFANNDFLLGQHMELGVNTGIGVNTLGDVLFVNKDRKLSSLDQATGIVTTFGTSMDTHNHFEIDPITNDLYYNTPYGIYSNAPGIIRKVDYIPQVEVSRTAFNQLTDTVANGATIINTITGTIFDENGLTYEGKNKYGRQIQSYDANGFRSDGIHRDTGTQFNSNGLTMTGSEYNAAGFNKDGLNAAGESGWMTAEYKNTVYEVQNTQILPAITGDIDPNHSSARFFTYDSDGNLFYATQEYHQKESSHHYQIIRVDAITGDKTLVKFADDTNSHVQFLQLDNNDSLHFVYKSELHKITKDQMTDFINTGSTISNTKVFPNGVGMYGFYLNYAILNDGSIAVSDYYNHYGFGKHQIIKLTPDGSGNHTATALGDNDENHIEGITKMIDPVTGEEQIIFTERISGVKYIKKLDLSTGVSTVLAGTNNGSASDDKQGTLAGSYYSSLGVNSKITGVHSTLTTDHHGNIYYSNANTLQKINYDTGMLETVWQADVYQAGHYTIEDIFIDNNGVISIHHGGKLLTLEEFKGGFVYTPHTSGPAVHSITGTEFDDNGLTITGSRFASDGYDAYGVDEWGYDRNGNIAYDLNGFSFSSGLHVDTGTAFNTAGISQNGTRYDNNGYNVSGFTVNGTHQNGTMYDDNGYNVEGFDQNGVFTDGSTVKNGELAKNFFMEHKVERDSFFKTLVETSKITKAGDTKLGRFYVRNNTRDGFEVSIDSAEGGVLHPTGVSESTLDGEVDIPYSIHISKEGDIGVGIDETYEFSSSDLASAAANRNSLDAAGIIGVTILKIAGGGSAASSATDAKFELFVNIQDDSNVMEMAGTYSDTLTLTYKDH